jgi:ATP-dependent Clp protease adaptor protein ClpS
LFTRESNPGRIDPQSVAAARDAAVTRSPRDIRAPATVLAGKGGRKSSGDGPGQGAGTAVIARVKPKTQRPSMYRVLLLNDDYTPMDFVVGVLCTFFHKNVDDANRIMWQVHNNGVGECGVYTYEVADTKVTQVMEYARKHQHPLQCIMEKK